MAVDFQRPDYKAALPVWAMVCDAADGEIAVKNGKETYLPKPNPDDRSKSNTARYLQYLKRAVFYNVTRRTLSGLVGTAFRKAPVISLPSDLDYLLSDCNGSGLSIAQQSTAALYSVLKKGRHALMVDYPPVDNISTLDMQRLNIRPSIVEFNAEQVINWRMDKIGGIWKLSLVVIAETVSTQDPDGFGHTLSGQYRVLRLTDGVYSQEIWVKSSNDWKLQSQFIPKQANGAFWDEIPFVFCGSINNDPEIDPSPLYDLASLNIAHYRNSADHEDSVFFVGQPQAAITGLTEEWRDHLEKTGIYIGSRTPMLLPANGDFKFAQVEPNTLVFEAMKHKESQMVAIGARLLDSGGAVKTATEAQGDQESEHSVLSMCVSNVNDAYEKCIAWCQRFTGSATDFVFAINTDYIESKLDAQLIVALVQLWQSGKYPQSDLWSKLRSLGLIDSEKTDDMISGEIESQGNDPISLDNVTGGAA